MIDYIELNCKVNPLQPGTEILIAQLSKQGFESFVETESGVLAYIPAHLFSKEKLNFPLSNEFPIQFTTQFIKGKNWNEEWEKSFQPVQIENQCYIRASFHPANPKVKYDIVIDPKMSFGTGHHETTTLMAQQILSTELNDRKVLDMGCGTGILAILSAKLGASLIVAIDNDAVAIESTIENIQKNNASHVIVQCGDASLLNGQKYDVILANINRNILLHDLPFYFSSLNKNGIVILSGYLVNDKIAIHNKAKELGLSLIDSKEKNNWVAERFCSL